MVSVKKLNFLEALFCLISISTLHHASSLTESNIASFTKEDTKISSNAFNVDQAFHELLKKVGATTYNVDPLYCPPKGFDKQETVPWGYKALNVATVAKKNKGPIKICMLDSGFDPKHPDFKGLNITYEALTLDSPEFKNEPFRKFLLQKDMYEERRLVLDPTIGKGNQDWVGTGTASIGVMAANNNKFGTRGILTGKFSIHMVKGIAFSLFGQSQPLLFGASLIGAVKKCEKIKAKVIVINAAFTGAYKQSEEDYFAQLYKRNILVFAPAGNFCPQQKSCQGEIFAYPSSYTRVNSVGSLNPDLTPTTSTTLNSELDFAGPSQKILTTVPSSFSSISVNQAGVGSCATITSKKLKKKIFTRGSLAMGSRGGFVTAPVAPCYIGANKCKLVKKKICLVITGGGISITKKVYSCQKGGALAAVIIPATDTPIDLVTSLDSKPYRNTTLVIPVVNVYYSAGQKLYAKARAGSKVKFALQATREKYRFLSGSYLANAAVAATASLVWRNHPLCTNAEILDAMKATALDLGSGGVDSQTGSGLPNAGSASAYLSCKPCKAYRK